MSLVKDMNRGFEFLACGMMADPLRIEDKETDTISRIIRVQGYGKRYNFFAETEEEFQAAPPPDTEVRVFGRLERQKGTVFMKPRVTGILYPGQPNWKPFSDEEVLSGCRFTGWGVIVSKKATEYKGVKFRNLQVGTMGDTFLFRDYESAALYEQMPETGPGLFKGHLETFVGSGERGKDLFMTPVIDAFRIRTPKDDEPDRKTPPLPEDGKKPT